ncbi:hypothetical protein HHL22_03135 [Hymenobacter sp. RP-2-7]|uniref:Uncharacterized protein n=1 Tax=Hymenobacter polaris TaxID=2682546 RepID=A0A7Y0ABB5_9BACT|nr:DUF1493 family protein [Hymenobacter polaris]NML64191.1 hypothetical protein [Hymenobacter polaris]
MEIVIPPPLISFLTLRLGQVSKTLSREAGLEATYGIAGLDTLQLYQDFVTEFQIETPADWNLSRHITSERLQPLHSLRQLFSTRYRITNSYIDLTLGNLADMLEAGIWLAP